jgi:hypothetical protein
MKHCLQHKNSEKSLFIPPRYHQELRAAEVENARLARVLRRYSSHMVGVGRIGRIGQSAENKSEHCAAAMSMQMGPPMPCKNLPY